MVTASSCLSSSRPLKLRNSRGGAVCTKRRRLRLVGRPASGEIQLLESRELLTVNITATDGSAAEWPNDSGHLTITRDGDTSEDLIVNYSLSGTATPITDFYESGSGSVVIYAGYTDASIWISPYEDTNYTEGNETVVVTVDGGASATITIVDTPAPTISITATDSAAAEYPNDSGYFTISRTGSTTFDLTVSYTLSGTATSGADYYDYGTASITIPAGYSDTTIWISPNEDTHYSEGAETVIATLSDGTNATITIADTPAPTISIAATDSAAAEYPNDSGYFTISRTGSTAFDLTVNYTLSGSATATADYNDYQNGSITIPTGSSNATIWIAPIEDTN